MLDCRGKPYPETGSAIIESYNALTAGARMEVTLDAYPAGLKVWLLEAGARHTTERLDDGGWRLHVKRGLTPAQGSVPGVHHVVSAGDSVWTCERAQRVARIDAHSRRVVASRHVARKASHLALGAKSGQLLIADSGGNEVIALRAADLEIEQRWPAPGGPQLPLASADGIVCVSGPASGTLTIARPRGAAYDVQTIAVGACPHDPLLSADEEHVFVPCAGDSAIVKVRLADGRVVGRCETGDGPSHLALHPDGNRIYAANSWDGTIACVSADGERIAHSHSGRWAHAIEVTPDGRWVYVANFLDDTLAVFDAVTLERVALLATDPYPHGLDISRDGRYAVATGFASEFVRVFDAGTQRELACIEVGQGSSHTAFTGTDAYVGCSVSDHIACIDLAALVLKDRIRIH